MSHAPASGAGQDGSGPRPLIVHADDLGLAHAFNAGIREAARSGLLTSTCVRVNGSAYEAAMDEVAPECPQLGIGIHLNLVEGRTRRGSVPRSSLLCDADGTYRATFTSLLRGQRNAALMQEIEADYRDQIEIALRRLPRPDHLNSHQHSHAVPALFELVCRLALEYRIPYVRLPRERFYVAGSAADHAHAWYPVNLAKVGILNALAVANERTARQHGVPTNEWLVGIAYTGYMNTERIHAGLWAVASSPGLVELLLHPCRLVLGREDRYLNDQVRHYVLDPAREVEVRALLDPSLPGRLQEQGWGVTCYACVAGSQHPVPSERVLPQPRAVPEIANAVPRSHVHTNPQNWGTGAVASKQQ
ncbi:MAG: carbohydrate deacetylase [Gemmatimonadaceae bacterium]